MAGEMECSERTVRRCVDHLRDVEGWPVEAGKQGYFLREPSVMETRITSHQEVAALAMAYESLRMIGGTELGVQIRAEVAKACRYAGDLGEVRWEDLNRLMQGRPDSGEAAMDFERQGRLTLAILQRQIVMIQYCKLEEDHSFEVKVFPHRLICREQCWYLIAEDLERGGQKTYALPRMSGVETSPRPDGFVEPEFDDRYGDAFGIWTPYEAGGDLYEVCVELSGYWARIARERRWHSSQELEEISPDRVRVRFRLSELVEVKSWVLRFGGAAKVMAPLALREMVCEEIAEMNNHYKL
jgi:predicted DNA-binding transcriptional regulator YafY